MDFNGRMSTARSSSHIPNTRGKQQEPEDAFMMPDYELAICINDIGIACTVEDLRKPNPQHVQKIFEYLASVLMNCTRDVVAPAMRAAAEEIVGPDAERLYTSDTRDLMGLFVMLRRLLLECSIDDFALSDLYRPTHQRLTKLLSYMINFVRWRESHTSIVDKHFDEAQRMKMRVQSLYIEKENLEARLVQLQRERASVEHSNKEKERQFAELKPNLKNLIEKKDRLQEEWNRCQQDLDRLKLLYEDRATTLDNLREEANRLKPYTLQNPETLNANVQELNSTLATARAQTEYLDRRTRALQTSADSFSAASLDIQSLYRLLTELASDLQKEEEEALKAVRHSEAFSERATRVEDLERRERKIRKQLENVQARMEASRKRAEENNERARVRMEELRQIHRDLGREREEKGREVERRRVRIEQVEKKMADLKEQIEEEVQAAKAEYVKMESHIRLYINEMEQSMS